MLYEIIVIVLQKFANTNPFHTTDDYSVIHYTNVDNDGQYDFRCPFCDFDIQVHVFCSDFEDVVYNLSVSAFLEKIFRQKLLLSANMLIVLL
jgi:hypothetical protein